MTQGTLGFIGLGNMGGRMTRRLVDAGLDVLGYDIDAALAPSVGARVAATVAEVAEQADYVLLSLPDSRVVESVMRGDDGVISRARAGQTVIDLSTAAPASTIALDTQLRERGAVLIDAGISGGAAAAEKGALTIMLGCEQARLSELSWLFAPIATKLVPMGAVGSGHAMKLLNNFLNAVALSATAEVMVAASKAGLDLDAVLEVLNASSGVNFATLNRFPHIVHGDYLEGGLTGALMTKDVTLYVEYVAALGVPSLNSAGPMASFGLANNLGYANQISNRVVDAIGDVAGRVRLSDPNHATSEGN